MLRRRGGGEPSRCATFSGCAAVWSETCRPPRRDRFAAPAPRRSPLSRAGRAVARVPARVPVAAFQVAARLRGAVARVLPAGEQLLVEADRPPRGPVHPRARPERTVTLAPDDQRHGTTNGYNNLGCRCDRCRAAWTEYYVEWTHRTSRHLSRENYRALLVSQPPPPHGTESRYSRGCRCDKCRRASANARYRRRVAASVNTHNRSG